MIVGVAGILFTVTETGNDIKLWQPFISEILTVRFPVVVSLMLWVVAPLDQE
jgi:hypothetical protein